MVAAKVIDQWQINRTQFTISGLTHTEGIFKDLLTICKELINLLVAFLSFTFIELGVKISIQPGSIHLSV
jgi:hypothetical protein